MTTYARDHDKTHDLTIQTLLRNFNATSSNNTEFERFHLYGSMPNGWKGPQGGLFMGPGSTKAFHYEDMEILKALIESACDHRPWHL